MNPFKAFSLTVLIAYLQAVLVEPLSVGATSLLYFILLCGRDWAAWTPGDKRNCESCKRAAAGTGGYSPCACEGRPAGYNPPPPKGLVRPAPPPPPPPPRDVRGVPPRDPPVRK